MKHWLSVLVSCCILTGCMSHKLPPGPPENATGKAYVVPQAGNYAGGWTGSDGNGGDLRISLKKLPSSPWEATVSFSIQGNESTTTMKSVEVNGSHIVLSFDYEIQGNPGSATMTGELAGDNLQGSYRVTTGDGNQGTWKASRVQ